MKKNMPNVALIPPADDCGAFFLVAPAGRVTVLIHRLHWSVQLNILFTANFTKHWDLLWSQPSGVADPQTHSPPGRVFTHQPVYDYLFHCGKPDWTPADTKPQTDKWIHTRTHGSDTYVYIRRLYKQTTLGRTHTYTYDPLSLLDGCDQERKVSIHQWRLYEWNNWLRTGSTESVTSHYFDGIPKKVWQHPGCDRCCPGWWGHTCGCLVYSVGTWWRLSTRSSWGLAATVAKALGVPASRRLTIHVFSNNKTHSHFSLSFLFRSFILLSLSPPRALSPLSPAHTHSHYTDMRGNSGRFCAMVSSALTLNSNQKSIWKTVDFVTFGWKPFPMLSTFMLCYDIHLLGSATQMWHQSIILSYTQQENKFTYFSKS